MDLEIDPRRRSRDAEESRNAIVASAVRLFGADGFHATPISRIVADAGYTKGAFYHHFKGKEELLLELHERFINLQLERLENVLEEDLRGDELIRRFVENVMLDPIARYQSEIVIFWQERQFISDDLFADVRRKRDRFETLVIELIERGVADGSIVGVEHPRLAAFAVIGMCAWAQYWINPSRTVEIKTISEVFTRILLGGFSSMPPGGPI